MPIHLIACIDMSNGIGSNGELLCKLEADMKHFKEKTTGNIVVMGRKTYESIGHPLSHRTNIILSRDQKYDPHPSVYVYESVEQVLHEYHNYGESQPDVYVIGGAKLYEEFLPHADYIHLTIVDYRFPEADVFFPRFSIDEFKPVERKYCWKDKNNAYDYTFITYERKTT